MCVSIALSGQIQDRNPLGFGTLLMWCIRDEWRMLGTKFPQPWESLTWGQSSGNLHVTRMRMNITSLIKELPVSVVIVL